ncbi:MAG TPA: peptidase M61 [Sphingobium sp.]|nr:peptidase M61 [Sphingobium sp.]
MRQLFALALLISTASFAPVALAQNGVEPLARSQPAAQPVVDAIPAPRDIPWPGTIVLDIDASDTTQRIWRVRQTISLASSGPLTLLYPEWLPGKHGPRGQIEKVAGLKITANGRAVGWTRDPVDVYAFHVEVPDGARELVLEFQFLNATKPDQGRIAVTGRMMNLQFETVSFYPAGHYVRRIPVRASVTYPEGWAAFSALRGSRTGATVRYEATDYETLIDSPVFAGRNSRTVDIGNGVTLDMVADRAAELAATPEQIATHRKLVAEALALFGARHFDRYSFLLAITEEMGGIGLEHHRSSENAVDPGYFTKWNDGPGDRNLLPHELVHSWNGKFRRPELLWTPDYRTPMQDNLLWVYEGQTQFWGYVLGARSGIYTKEQTLDALASIAARLDLAKGREWRPLADTTHDPIISARRPKAWASWQRSEDYYNEGLLTWLEADAIIRRQSRGARGMDDFARAFFGTRDGDWGVLTYTRKDVVDTLNAVQPFDWASFLRTRVDSTSKEAPKGGLELGGYRLVYGETPNSTTKDIEKAIKGIDQSYGVGLAIETDGDIVSVIWNSPAFEAGLAAGMKIIAVNGIEFSGDVFKEALTDAKKEKKPIDVIVKQDSNYRTIRLDYSFGLRYPRLEKSGEGEGSLDRLLQPRT